MFSQDVGNGSVQDQSLCMLMVVITECSFHRMRKGQMADVMQKCSYAKQGLVRAKMGHQGPYTNRVLEP